jgi:hypothetical protein
LFDDVKLNTMLLGIAKDDKVSMERSACDEVEKYIKGYLERLKGRHKLNKRLKLIAT